HDMRARATGATGAIGPQPSRPQSSSDPKRQRPQEHNTPDTGESSPHVLDTATRARRADTGTTPTRFTSDTGRSRIHASVLRARPADTRGVLLGVDAVLAVGNHGEHRLDQSVGQQMWLQSQFDEPGVLDVVVVLGVFDTGIVQVLYLDRS